LTVLFKIFASRPVSNRTMKYILFVAGLLAALALGYMSEPKFRFKLTGKLPAAAAPAAPANTVVVSIPSPNTPAASAIDPSKLDAGQLPETVVLRTEAEVGDASSGLKMKIQAGNRVKLVRIAGQTAVISPGAGPFEGFVPISGTDLMEQLAANPPQPMTEESGDEPAMDDSPISEPDSEPADGDNPFGFDTPAEDASADMPEPAATPEEPSGESAEEPAEETAEAPAVTGPVDVVATMKESIGSGRISEFKTSQVLTWEAGENEEIDGATYQTGLVSYKAETIFGEKTIQAKALIRNGTVERWIWPKSGLEIK
jgi:hypothetical protein